MIELVRRMVLLACFCAGLGLAFLPSLNPLVIVKPVDVEKKSERAVGVPDHRPLDHGPSRASSFT